MLGTFNSHWLNHQKWGMHHQKVTWAATWDAVNVIMSCLHAWASTTFLKILFMDDMYMCSTEVNITDQLVRIMRTSVEVALTNAGEAKRRGRRDRGERKNREENRRGKGQKRTKEEKNSIKLWKVLTNGLKNSLRNKWEGTFQRHVSLSEMF